MVSVAVDRVRAALDEFRSAAHAVDAAHAGDELAKAIEDMLGDTEWEQRVSVKMPRRRRDDGVWVSTRPNMIDGTSVRELLDAQTFYFEFDDEMVDDYMGREVAVLLRHMSDWLMSHPEATVMGVAVEPKRDDSRTHAYLTVEGLAQ